MKTSLLLLTILTLALAGCATTQKCSSTEAKKCPPAEMKCCAKKDKAQ